MKCLYVKIAVRGHIVVLKINKRPSVDSTKFSDGSDRVGRQRSKDCERSEKATFRFLPNRFFSLLDQNSSNRSYLLTYSLHGAESFLRS
jgi:hypothetical protein